MPWSSRPSRLSSAVFLMMPEQHKGCRRCLMTDAVTVCRAARQSLADGGVFPLVQCRWDGRSAEDSLLSAFTSDYLTKMILSCSQ